MQVFRLSLSAALCAALLLTSCRKSQCENPTVAFEPYRYEAIVNDSASAIPGQPSSAIFSMSGSGVLPVVDDDPGMTSLRDSLVKLAHVRFVDGKPSPMLEKGMAVVAPSDSVLPGGTSINRLQLVLFTPEVLVWESTEYTYFYHAAHGGTSLSYVNYSLDRHCIIELPMLMKKDCEERLAGMLRRELSERDDLLVPLAEVEIPVEWRFTTDGLEFVWQQYEIAPYSSGIIRVTLQSYDLEPILSATGRHFLDIQD